jgi:hypothetical protein
VERFGRICVLDSTGWGLHPKLKTAFPGSGGAASEAGCKLQFGYDLKSSSVFNLQITAGNRSDHICAKELPAILQPKDLLLVDLGYFSLPVLKQLIANSVSFVCRYQPKTNVYRANDGKQIDFAKLLSKHNKQGVVDLPMQIGERIKLNCRLVAIKLPSRQVNQKLRTLKDNARRKGRTISRLSRVLAQWNIYLTDLDAKQLPVSQISALYRLRWSIELIFKQFKSILHLHHWNHANKHRLLCEVMGTLIVAVLVLSFHGMLQAYAWSNSKREISFGKLFTFVRNSAVHLFDMIAASPAAFQRLWRNLTRDALKFAKKDSTAHRRPSSLLTVIYPKLAL